VRRCAVQRAKGQTSQSCPLSGFISFILSPPSFSLLLISPPSPLPLPYLRYPHHHHPSRPLSPPCPPFPAITSTPIWLPVIRPTMEFLQHHHHHSLSHLLHPAEHSHPFRDNHPDERCSRFPTSEDRFEGTATPSFRSSLCSPARYDPLGSLLKDEHALARKALCSSFTPLFLPSYVSLGVLSNGTWTTEHPSVYAFLQSPSSRPNLTFRTSAAIYSLAALRVFYSPSHPSYDVFWHPDIKEATAEFVHEVVSKYTHLSLHTFSSS
jgi:hypothetical protein